MSPRLRLAIALTALAAGLVNLALLLRAGEGRPRPLAYLLITMVGVSWSFVGAGLVAWTRRPTNRTGALMVAVGLSYALLGLFFNAMVLVATPAAFALWYLANSLPPGVIAHLLAVFPDGRSTTRLQRVFVVANYVATVPLAVVQLLLVPLDRLGCAGCPDQLAVPGNTSANVDHLVIGPSGVFVIDSKQWSGSIHQGADGLAWHNHYPLDRTLETVRWEAERVGRLLGTRIHRLLCVHGAHVQGGGLHAQGVAIVPAHLLRGALGDDRVLSDADVALLAATAWTSLRPAA